MTTLSSSVPMMTDDKNIRRLHKYDHDEFINLQYQVFGNDSWPPVSELHDDWFNIGEFITSSNVLISAISIKIKKTPVIRMIGTLPQYRCMGSASRLLQTVTDSLNHTIIVKDYIESAKLWYLNRGFFLHERDDVLILHTNNM